MLSVVVVQQLALFWLSGTVLVEAAKIPSVKKSPPGFPLEAETGSLPVLTTFDGWTFDWRRDGTNHALSSEQCMAAFPELYFEIDRAVKYWSHRDIGPESIPLHEAGVRVLLHGQEVRVVQSQRKSFGDSRAQNKKDFSGRISAVLRQLERAITSGTDDGDVPSTELTISVEDYPRMFLGGDLAIWSFTRSLESWDDEGVWVIPDFTLWNTSAEAQSLLEMQEARRYHDSSIRGKRPKIYWRGIAREDSSLEDHDLLPLTRDQSWADVEEIPLNDEHMVESEKKHCDYQLALAAEDTSFRTDSSWPRNLIRILGCDTVPVIPYMYLVAHYHHLLQPDINYASIAESFSELEWRTRSLLWNIDEAQVIADNARVTFRERYLTPAATACYWRSLVRRWSSVAFEPTLYQDSSDPGQDSSRQLRGLSLEEFLSRADDVEYIMPKAYEPRESVELLDNRGYELDGSGSMARLLAMRERLEEVNDMYEASKKASG